MKRNILIAYQCLAGLSDTSTGILLLIAPEWTLHRMQLQVATTALPFLSYIGAFVLSVGIACFYGALLAKRLGPSLGSEGPRLETVWLLTGITRAIIAAFVVIKVASHGLEPGWSSVALTDGVFALLQFAGLARGWLRHVHP